MHEFFTVSQLNEYINALLLSDSLMGDLWLKGEISGFRLYRQSGHMYFTLKDQESTISCVMFRSRARQSKIVPADGMEVLVRGSVSVFARQGKYQVYVEEIQPYGVGGLYLYLEKLKQAMEKAGYFSPEKKKPIPVAAHRIGVVTSQDGAALRDILRVLKLRHPYCQVVLVHSAVQGPEAARELARGIRLLNEYGQVDVIIVGRGGGSLEDLMPFNSEEVVKAIYDSHIPVISAVGHEVDFSLADLAADLRAATPTQAAQLAVPDLAGLHRDLDKLRQRMTRTISRRVQIYNESLDRLMMRRIWQQPGVLMERRSDMLKQYQQRLQHSLRLLVHEQEARVSVLTAALDSLSPLKVMQRGYALVRRQKDIVIRAEQVNCGDILEVCLQDANIGVEVVSKEAVERWTI